MATFKRSNRAHDRPLREGIMCQCSKFKREFLTSACHEAKPVVFLIEKNGQEQEVFGWVVKCPLCGEEEIEIGR